MINEELKQTLAESNKQLVEAIHNDRKRSSGWIPQTWADKIKLVLLGGAFLAFLHNKLVSEIKQNSRIAKLESADVMHKEHDNDDELHMSKYQRIALTNEAIAPLRDQVTRDNNTISLQLKEFSTKQDNILEQIKDLKTNIGRK